MEQVLYFFSVIISIIDTVNGYLSININSDTHVYICLHATLLFVCLNVSNSNMSRLYSTEMALHFKCNHKLLLFVHYCILFNGKYCCLLALECKTSFYSNNISFKAMVRLFQMDQNSK